ncbi:hypothetical protein IFM89_007288 [Coptis chinensis]|uniref:F-box domain-containing protein n=1 Tax=Coptis chinensis TaxID=261450 RepID=A0A835GXP1_9MAGN|nr:hypothetical protein IFM89_007288 [Coptis chinensis]
MEMTKGVSWESSGSWSQLPEELLSLINERLSLLDLIRFSCVCPTWRCVSASEISNRRYRLPWLILPNEFESNSNEKDCSSRDLFLGYGDMYARMFHMHCKQDTYYCDGLLSFYSVLERKIYRVETPHGQRICGTSFGWLIIIGENSDMKLFHPFTGKVLDLPPLQVSNNALRYKYRLETGILYNATMNAEECYADYIRNAHKDEVVASCGSDSSNSICHPPIVLNIPLHLGKIVHKQLHFTRPGKDDSWIAIESERGNHYDDLIYFNGEYYALKFGGDVVVVKGLDGYSMPTTSLVASSNKFVFSRDSFYLVATSSDLLKVTRILDDFNATQRFLVQKLDFAEAKWLEVDSLTNCALFVGVNDSFSVVASEFPGCKENCIYFFTGEDKGVFNLQDGTIQTICPSDSKFISPQPIRFSANPC